MKYANGKEVKMIRPCIRSDNTGIVEVKQGPMLGENTSEILREHGYSEEAIQKLVYSKAVKQHA